VPLFTSRLVPVYVAKTANETVTSSATLQNDDHLALAVSASATYVVNLFLIIDGSLAGDFKMGFTGPAGATMDWVIAAQGTGATTTNGNQSFAYQSLATSDNAGTIGAGSKLIIRPQGTLVVSTTAGTLQLQWAQNTSDATATTLYAGSWLRLERVL
jgi:hypothetical protein